MVDPLVVTNYRDKTNGTNDTSLQFQKQIQYA